MFIVLYFCILNDFGVEHNQVALKMYCGRSKIRHHNIFWSFFDRTCSLVDMRTKDLKQVLKST